jgi:YbbR domain-containing protein
LTGLDAGEHNLPIQVQVDTQPVRVMSLSPAVITVVLEPLGTRTLPVELILNGELAIGYEASEPILAPNTVTITGPEALVNRVSSVYATLDISGARESIELPLAVVPVDASGEPIAGLSITPNTVNLSMAISQQGGYRDLVVKLVLVGRVENEYRLASIAVLPPVVTVYSADTELINSLPAYVETIALNLDGLSADFETNIQLNLPPGVTLVGQQTVLIQVDIAPIEGSINLFDRPVEVTGLRTGLKVQISPETVDIILSGPLPVLNTLSAEDVRVVVDVSGLGPGTYQLTPEVDIVIEGIKVESFLPASVEVIIK